MFKYETDSNIQSLIDHMILAKEGKSIPKEDDPKYVLDTKSLYPHILRQYNEDGTQIDHAQEMLHALSNSHYGLIGQRPKVREHALKNPDPDERENDYETVVKISLIEDLRQQLAYLKQKWPV